MTGTTSLGPASAAFVLAVFSYSEITSLKKKLKQLEKKLNESKTKDS